MTIFAAVFGSSSGKGATPPIPTLSYTAEKQFTITNYDPTLIYDVVNATRSASVITINNTGTTATITSKYTRSVISSSSKNMLTAIHTRVLTSSAGGVSSEGCGPRPTICCPVTITGVDGSTCGSGGTRGNFAGCPTCPSQPFEAGCFGLFLTCWNWYWTDYSGSGYNLFGSVWGKAE